MENIPGHVGAHLCRLRASAPEPEQILRWGGRDTGTETGEKTGDTGQRTQSVSTTPSREQIYIFKAQNQSENRKGTYDTLHFSFSCPGKEDD